MPSKLLGSITYIHAILSSGRYAWSGTTFSLNGELSRFHFHCGEWQADFYAKPCGLTTQQAHSAAFLRRLTLLRSARGNQACIEELARLYGEAPLAPELCQTITYLLQASKECLQ